MVEGLFLEDMKKRGKEVRRNMAFESYSVPDNKTGPLQVNCRANVNQDKRSVLTQYLIGCSQEYPRCQGCRHVSGCHLGRSRRRTDYRLPRYLVQDARLLTRARFNSHHSEREEYDSFLY
ncbi:hypothetical protein LB505_002805 [Fusarium chuoi]|nr:hypothetical protein LB505_002805 [Fusarium chuoi]